MHTIRLNEHILTVLLGLFSAMRGDIKFTIAQMIYAKGNRDHFSKTFLTTFAKEAADTNGTIKTF